MPEVLGRIRVAQFLTATVRSGAEEVALEMVRGLDPRQFQSFLICPPELLEAFGDDWRAPGVEALPLDLGRPWNPARATRLVRFLRNRKIDILHAHMTRAALPGVPLARLAGVPVVLHTCHGREAWRTGHGWNGYWVDRRLHAWSDTTIAVSQATRDYLVEEKELDPAKVIVIRNGRSLGSFRPDFAVATRLREELGLAAADSVAAVFGRLEPQKGHRYLLEALPVVLARAPRLKVLFVGDGQLRAELESLAEARGVRRAVIFTGYRKDWKHLMSLCDFVVLPSLYEGLPLVLIEAGAMGKAVVATSVDGSREVVEDGRTGVLVPAREPGPLADAVISLTLDPAARQRMAAAGRARACEVFSLERQLETTSELYRRMLGRATPAAQKVAAQAC
jgi:glycosyltransferase involved in cell wall biosynthesis